MITQKIFTTDDFHQFTERVEARFELVDGQIVSLYSGEPVDETLVAYVLSGEFDQKQLPTFPMPTQRHDAIVSNLHILLGILLKGKFFKVYSQATSVFIQKKEQSRLPDIVVVRKDEQRTQLHAVLNPVVLMEVLSRSTQNIDKAEKLEEYQSLLSVEEYIMVAQDQPRVTVYRKISASKWEEEIFEGLDHGVEMKSLGL
ncbi:MAG: Uma2 family endonuclease, partial [Ferruginibacter sp.]|nr:Uma2 family endonuclease [Cytophagales bacterium]